MEVGFRLDLKVSRERATQLLTRLANGLDPFAFEIFGLPDSVSIQFACSAHNRMQVVEQIKAFFPEAILRDRPGFLAAEWRAAADATAMVDFGLSREFMIPLRTGKDFEVDPLISIVAALGEIGFREMGVFQILAGSHETRGRRVSCEP